MRRLLLVSVLGLSLMAGKCDARLYAACPPLKEYSAEFRVGLSKEIDEIMHKYPYTMQVIGDYGLTRDDIRDCMAGSKKG